MRFTRLQAIRFGPLVDFDTGAEPPLPGLVAIHGPNEAGKSACHLLIASLIQGVYPATRDQHPFTPWGGGDIEVRAEMRLDDGSAATILRRLLSTPKGDFLQGGSVEVLGNRALPFAAHVNRGLYQQVYAIGLPELAKVHDEAWDAVRDHLVVGMGSEDLHPPREVAKELLDRGARLWRPTRQGKPVHRELQAELTSLRERRRSAAERDAELRRAWERRAGLEEELAGIQTRRGSLTARLAGLRSMAPLRTRLHRIDRLTAEVGEIETLRALPRDPRAHLLALQERAEMDRQGRVERLRFEASVLDAVRPLREPDGGPVADFDEIARTFLSTPLPRLRGLLSEMAVRTMRLREAEGGLEEIARRPVPPATGLPLPPLVAGVGAVAFLLFALLRGGALPWIGAGVLASLALALFARFREDAARTRAIEEARRSEEREMRDRHAAAERDVGGTEAEIEAQLAPLGLGARARALPLPQLVEEIDALVERLRGSPPSSAEGGERAEQRLRDFEDALRRAGGGTAPEEIAVVEARLRALADLERLTAEVEGESGSLQELRERIRAAEREGEGWREIPERIALEEAALEALDRRIQELQRESGALATQIDQLERAERLDLVDGRMEETRARIIAVERERDRLFLLARILERAEARFREAHQPELLRIAEGYLARITGGRYGRILTERGADPSELHLTADHLPAPTRVAAPLSTGTREQVYLALRLAIVEHLDEGKETLPLLLDEVLVNWDPERRGRALDLLQELSDRRQIFLFTCHPQMAEEVRRRGGGVVELPRPTRPRERVEEA